MSLLDSKQKSSLTKKIRFWKITSENETHHDMTYRDGLNVDVLPFDPSGSCEPGGIYFSDTENILAFLNYGPWIREVTIPKGTSIYQDPEMNKYKAHKVVLGPRRPWAECIRELIEAGANVHADDDLTLRFASQNGHPGVVQILLEAGANVHADDDWALRMASWNGHPDVVRLLLEHGANVHADDGRALRLASWNGHPDVVRLLLEHGANVHVRDDLALRLASDSGHLDVVRLLLEHGANVHARDDYALLWASRNGHLDVVKLLNEWMEK